MDSALQMLLSRTSPTDAGTAVLKITAGQWSLTIATAFVTKMPKFDNNF